MKVLHFTNSYYPNMGGIESVIENLSLELKEKGVQSDVLTLNRVRGKRLEKEGMHKGARIFRLPFLDLKYYKVSAVPFSLIRKYDVVHIHSLGFLSDVLLLTRIFHKKRIIVSTHGGIFHTKNIGFLKKLYFFGFERMLLKNAGKIVAVSKEDKELFGRISKNVVLIENGISLPKAKPRKEKNRFLFVGRLSKNKRIDLLLEAFSRIKGARLVICGSDFDNLSEGLRQRAAALGMGKMTEFKTGLSNEEIFSEYNRAEYFVSASEYEGFGIAAIEAMHFGCVCILSDIPTFRDFCSDGKGHIVDFSRPRAAAEKIRGFLGKENGAMAKKALDFSKGFEWKKKIGMFIEIYGQGKG